jgi:sugar/nucleoside kinase (ribokinase family)
MTAPVPSRRSLLVVGSVAYDDIDGPFGPRTNLLGGSASFFAVAASYFTDKVSIIAVVGDDFDPAHLELFASRGIDCRGIEKAPGETFHWSGAYADDLATRRSLSTELGVFADFEPRLGPSHAGTELLFLGNIHPALQSRVLDQVERPALVAADTMNFWIEGTRRELEATLERVHTLVINDEEARQLAEEHNLVRAAAAIRAMGPSSVVIKRADSGALLFYEGGVFAAPALPLEEVRDPTGAGDTFAGGFMGYLARAGEINPASIRTAMIFGSVMASFVVEDFSLDGIRDLARADIQARFDAFGSLTRYDSIHL